MIKRKIKKLLRKNKIQKKLNKSDNHEFEKEELINTNEVEALMIKPKRNKH